MSFIPQEIPTGAVRFNTDSSKMEVYIGSTWMEVAVSSPNLDGGARGIVAGGGNGVSDIEFLTISTTGSADDFGNLTQAATLSASGGSHVRALTMIATTSHNNAIEFVTISSTGNAQDFGDIGGTNRRNTSCTGSRTRMLICGGVYGSNPYSYKDEIDFLTISQTGNSQDFGDLTLGRTGPFAMSSPTRSVLGGGYHGSSPNGTNIMDFVTIATTGNAQDFGDLTQINNFSGGTSCSNSTIGIAMGGREATGSTTLTEIQKIIIATKGNAAKFGDLTVAVRSGSAVSSKTRGVRVAGYAVPANSNSNSMDYFELATEGDAVDFGDFTRSTSSMGTGTSNDHGGL